ISKLRRRKRKPPPLDLPKIELNQRQICPVIPADKSSRNPLETRKRHRKIDRLRTRHMGIGQNISLIRKNHSRTDTRNDLLPTVLKRPLANIDPNNRIQQIHKIRPLHRIIESRSRLTPARSQKQPSGKQKSEKSKNERFHK